MLTNVWMKQRKSTANVSPPLIASLPIWPPVLGEYGRLDSPWRVRSHLETPGQPKAGTVTITRPQSLWVLTHWEHDGKKLRRRDSMGEAVGPRRRGICVIINDQWWDKEKKQSVSHTMSDLFRLKQASAFQWMKWRVWHILLTSLWEKYALNWKLKVQFCMKNVEGKKYTSSSIFISDGCNQYKKRSIIKQRVQSKDFFILVNA